MKTSLGPVPLLYPVPIVLVGADVGGRSDFATVGDVAIMGIRPPLVCISVAEGHHTTAGIAASSVFSINVPNQQLLAEVDCCGSVSGRDVDKAALFTVLRGKATGVPMVAECPVNLECEVIHEFVVEHRRMLIAKVIETHVDAELMRFREEHGVAAAQRYPLMSEIDPIVYALDNRYYRIGEPVGQGYQAGRHLVEMLRQRAERGE